MKNDICIQCGKNHTNEILCKDCQKTINIKAMAEVKSKKVVFIHAQKDKR